MLVMDSWDVCSICGLSRLGNMMIDDGDDDDDDGDDDDVGDDDDENQWMEWAGLFPSKQG